MSTLFLDPAAVLAEAARLRETAVKDKTYQLDAAFQPPEVEGRDCLASGVWPAYPREVAVVSPPPWEMRWVTDGLADEAWEAFAA